MGTRHSGDWHSDHEPSWTDETLPLEVRRKLLDKALDMLKAQKVAAHGHAGNHGQPEHPGESGSESSAHSA